MLSLRPAIPADTALILRFIKELAVWEDLAHEVTTDEATLRHSLFTPPIHTFAMIAEAEGHAVGFCIYFYNFSTFLGRRGIYIEDLYITPDARGKGYGRAILRHLARKVMAEGGGRLEWWVLNDNTQAVEFYSRFKARPMSEWTVQRLEGDTLRQLAQEPAFAVQ